MFSVLTETVRHGAVSSPSRRLTDQTGTGKDRKFYLQVTGTLISHRHIRACLICARADSNSTRYRFGLFSAFLFSFQHSPSFLLLPSSITTNQPPADLVHLDIFHLYHFQFENKLVQCINFSFPFLPHLPVLL